MTKRSADLVLIGVHCGDPTGMQAVELLLAVHPAAAVIVIGSPGDSALLIAAITRGVCGIMLWDVTHQCRTTPNFQLCTAGSTPALGGFPGTALSDQELHILNCISLGHSNRQIGRALFLSEDTVKGNARRMFAKLGARDRAHAVAIGMRRGLLA